MCTPVVVFGERHGARYNETMVCGEHLCVYIYIYYVYVSIVYMCAIIYIYIYIYICIYIYTHTHTHAHIHTHIRWHTIRLLQDEMLRDRPTLSQGSENPSEDTSPDRGNSSIDLNLHPPADSKDESEEADLEDMDLTRLVRSCSGDLVSFFCPKSIFSLSICACLNLSFNNFLSCTCLNLYFNDFLTVLLSYAGGPSSCACLYITAWYNLRLELWRNRVCLYLYWCIRCVRYTCMSQVCTYAQWNDALEVELQAAVYSFFLVLFCRFS
jgi:hypothetical protein